MLVENGIRLTRDDYAPWTVGRELRPGFGPFGG